MLNKHDWAFLGGLKSWDLSEIADDGTFSLNPNFCRSDLPLKFTHVCGIRDILKVVPNARSNFDPDYETYIWLGPDGHGSNGAPYRIRDILDEMERYAEELCNLEIEIEAYSQRQQNNA